MSDTRISAKSIKEIYENINTFLKEIISKKKYELKVPPFFDNITDGSIENKNICFLPIAVLKTKNEEYWIFDGLKRYFGLANDDNSCINVLVYENKTEYSDMFFINVMRMFFNSDRKKNNWELLNFFKSLQKFFNLQEINEYCDLFGLTSKEIKLLSEILMFESFVVDAVKEGIIELSNAYLLTRFSSKDIDVFKNFFSDFKLSRQYEREFLEFLPEIAYANNTTIVEILNSTELQSIKNDNRLNQPQKIEKLRKALYNLRYKNLSEVMDLWKKNVSKINPMPGRVKFKNNLGFEKEIIDIDIRITSSTDAKKIFKALSEIDESIWNLLLNPYKMLKK